MAESEKGNSSSVNSKEKKTALDDEIGKEFLRSWKSMSMTENDTMDFSFDTISSGKKKGFNFGKLDMDFSLDGDFDKLSSFNVDMPDLDFSCSSKKVAKPKDQSEQESSGINHHKKDNRFNFSFDFNVLDDFNLDSTLTKREKAQSKKFEGKLVSSDKSEHQTSKINLDVDGVADAFDEGQIKKGSISQRMGTSGVETVVGDGENGNGRLHSESGSLGDLVVSHGERTSDKIITSNAEINDQQILCSANTMAMVPSTEETLQTLPVQLLGGDDSIQDIVSDVQNSESGVENVNNGMIAGIGSVCVNSELKNPSENKTESEHLEHALQVEDTSTASLSGTISNDYRDNKNVQKLTSKLLVTLDSDHAVANVKPIKQKESGVVHSKYFARSEETEPQPCQPSLTNGEVSSLGSKENSLMHLNHNGNEKSKDSNTNDTQVSRKVVDDSKFFSGASKNGQPAVMGSEKVVKSLCNIRDGLGENGVQSACKPAVNSRLTNTEVKGAPHMLGSIKNTKDLNNFRYDANASSSTDKTTKSYTQTSENSTVLISNVASKCLSIEGIKGGKGLADISSLKTLRILGTSKDQSVGTPQRESNSSINSEKSMDLTENRVSTIVHPVSKPERRIPMITSLKRKAMEASDVDPVHLNLHKRLSQSPSESRNFNAPPESKIGAQVYNHCNMVGSKIENVYSDHPTSGHEMPQEMNMKEVEISLSVENDRNVEKAEAYAKELEDICYMLKKKHEEAKEILVRAIVNNNNLLILNHPIFEEKIRKVQKFATQLMSN